jgi:phosphoglucosamine mutase
VNLADAIVRYEDLDDKARIMVKVRVNDIECLSNPAVSETFDRICLELGENGRLLTRRSGVIPEIAILIEADTDRKCITYMNRFLDVLWEEGFTVEE